MLNQIKKSSHSSPFPTTSVTDPDSGDKALSTPGSIEQSQHEKKTDGRNGLREKHEQISKSSVTFPDARQQKLGHKKSKENAEKLKSKIKPSKKTKTRSDSDSSEIVSSYSSADKSSSNTESDTGQDSPQSLKEKLRELKSQRDAAEANNKEKLARKIQTEIDTIKKKLAKPEKQKSAANKLPKATLQTSEAENASPSKNSYDLYAIHKLINERLIKVSELMEIIESEKVAASVDGDATCLNQAQKDLQVMHEELQTLLNTQKLMEPRDVASPRSTFRSTADPTLKTTTTTTVPSTTSKKTRTASQSASPSGKTSKLSEIHGRSCDSNRKSWRNSSLILNEDLQPYFSESALKEIAGIDAKIKERAERADALMDKAREMKAKLDESEEIGEPSPAQLNADRNKLMKAAASEWSAIGKLLEQRMKLEERVLPTHLADQYVHDEEDFQAFINGFKSDRTLKLEAAHKKALEDLGKNRESSPISNILWNLAAGASGFSVSFLIWNTVFRLAPTEAQWLRVIGPPLLSATTHVIFATPVVKQLMAQSWSSNAMTALNNNFKLHGARWGESIRKELNVANYVSKDPDKTEKITIDQRLAEEPSFRSLFWNRYVDEEAAYYSYSMNYVFKAAAASAMAPYLADGSSDSILMEAGLHGFAGLCSGAEYVMFQQGLRSQRVNAKASPVPTREIFGLEAEALESLRHDLQSAIEDVEAQGPQDDTHRKLARALRRTEKALLAATLKSKRAGLMRHEFWAQFSKEAWRDTLSEVLGRALSLLTVAGVNEMTADMRKSRDPMMMFLGHMLPAIFLIMPPGWTARPLFSGLIRALMQAFETARATRRPPQQQAVAPVEDAEAVRIETEASSEIVAFDTEESDSEEQWQGNPTEREKERGGW